MTANDVYNVAKALPLEEFKRLYDILSKDLNKIEMNKKPRKKKLQLISDQEASDYILETVFKVKLKKS